MGGWRWIASMVVPRPRVDARFDHVEIWSRSDHVYLMPPGWNPDKSDDEERGTSYWREDTQYIDGHEYTRIDTPHGVEKKKSGLGFCLYTGTALVASCAGWHGVYSAKGERSPSAEAWWKKAVEEREGELVVARTKTASGEVEDVEICHSVDEECSSGEVDGWCRGEVCGPTTMEYERELDYIYYRDVLEFGLVLGTARTESWMERDAPAQGRCRKGMGSPVFPPDDMVLRLSVPDDTEGFKRMLRYVAGSSNASTVLPGLLRRSDVLERLPALARTGVPDDPGLVNAVRDVLAEQERMRRMRVMGLHGPPSDELPPLSVRTKAILARTAPLW